MQFLPLRAGISGKCTRIAGTRRHLWGIMAWQIVMQLDSPACVILFVVPLIVISQDSIVRGKGC